MKDNNGACEMGNGNVYVLVIEKINGMVYFLKSKLYQKSQHSVNNCNIPKLDPGCYTSARFEKLFCIFVYTTLSNKPLTIHLTC